jgi:hypothetical protein
MFLIVENEACCSLSTQQLVVGLGDVASLVLLILKGLEKVSKYFSFVFSSLLVVKLFYVENTKEGFRILGFNRFLSASKFLKTKMKFEEFFPGPALDSK